MNTEQLNIEGKRSGEGFYTHKSKLVNALSRALSERVVLMDFTIGRKGFLAYLKSLGGSNIVKVIPSTSSGQVPANVSASETQANGTKRLKVVCGNNTSYLEDMAWIDTNTTPTVCHVRVSPSSIVQPNLGALELAEALSRVVPFASRESTRVALQSVLFRVKDGKLTLVSADGFRLAVVKLDFGSTGSDSDEGQALIASEELRGIISALRKAYRVRLSFEKSGKSLDEMSLVLDTELIRYKWRSADGTFPEYEKLIPTDFKTVAGFDTHEAIKAVNSLKVLSNSKNYPIDLTIGNGKIVLSSPDDKGLAEIAADVQGEGKIRIDGSFLADALKACGGMVELKVVSSTSPMLFASPNYELVIAAMFTGETQKQSSETQTHAEPVKPATDVTGDKAKAHAVAEAEAIAKGHSSKVKPSKIVARKATVKAKEPVTVA